MIKWIISSLLTFGCASIAWSADSPVFQKPENIVVVPENKLDVFPPTTASSGTQFTVEIKAQGVTGLFGISFILNWTQGAYVDYVKAEQGDFLGSDIIFYPSADESGSKVSIGISRKSGQSDVSGSGVLARITFVSSLSTPNNTAVQFSLSEITANKGDGSSIQLFPDDGFTALSSGLTVWPGDTNNTGKVDQSDILPLGLYWTKTGSPRTNRSNSWAAQTCQPWFPTAATYADANGDGSVNQADVLVIGLNWNRSHVLAKDSASKTYAGGTIVPAPQANIPIASGIEFYVDVNLQDASGVFGVSFVLSYDNKDYIEPLSAEMGTFLGSDVIFFPQIDVLGDNVNVGISPKSGQVDKSGAGTIVRVKCKASKNIEKGTKITFYLTDIVANNSTGDEVIFTPKPGFIGDDVGVGNATPAEFSLYQNTPNPFNPKTVISYTLGSPCSAKLNIYNVSGQLIRTLADGTQSRGHHEIVWDGRDGSGMKVSAGVYIYRLRTGDFTQSRKMLFLQ